MNSNIKEFMDIVIELEKKAISERKSGMVDSKVFTGNRMKIDTNIVNKLISLVEGGEFTNEN